jgi:cytoplasmic iron level regulating protein YaaA (DUF328/UPF0246 family)
MNDDLNFEDTKEYTFRPDDFEPIMERMRGMSTFFGTHTTEDLIEKFKKFQKIGLDGNYVMSIKIIEKFSDYLVSDTLNELVEKGLVDYYWSDEHQDFVFKAK